MNVIYLFEETMYYILNLVKKKIFIFYSVKKYFLIF